MNLIEMRIREIENKKKEIKNLKNAEPELIKNISLYAAARVDALLDPGISRQAVEQLTVRFRTTLLLYSKNECRLSRCKWRLEELERELKAECREYKKTVRLFHMQQQTAVYQ